MIINFKKPNIICFLLFIVCFLFLVSSAKSQSPETGIALTWTADTYVPLNYPGKALPTRKSAIEVVATINNLNINPEELIYYWFVNDRIKDNGSRKGNQVFEFELSEALSQITTVRVKAKDQRGNPIAESNYLVIKPSQPEIIIQTDAPFLIGERLIPEYQISANQEVKFTARPYFFKVERPDELDYEWNVVGKTSQKDNGENSNILVLKISQVVDYIEQTLTAWVKNSYTFEKGQASVKLLLRP